MIQFLIKRLLYGLLVLWGVVTVVFFIFQVLPGDPVSMMMGQRSDLASQRSLMREYGLDKPLGQQYLHYMNDLSLLSWHERSDKNQVKYDYTELFGNSSGVLVFKSPYMRRSFTDNRLVSEVLSEGFVRTLWLAVTAMLLASIFGILLGIWAALKQNSWLDKLLVSGSILGISIPSFVSGVLLAFLFAVKLQAFTNLNLFGYMVEIDPFKGKTLVLKNLFLPALTLGIRPLAIIVQLTRSSVLDVIKEDYIRTARAKGLSERVVVFKHVLRNALNPVVTIISGWFASLLAGAFFVEMIFSWGGLGAVTVQAVFAKNFPLVMGTTLFVAVVFVLVNILVDIIYALLDPRIKLDN